MPTTLHSIKKFFKKRNSESHKGQNGKVLVIGGSNDLVGAPALSAMASLAALRSGVDLVTVFAPEKAGFVINSYSPDLIVKKAMGGEFSKTHLKEALLLAKKSDVALIGPGIGNKKFALIFAGQFIKKNSGKMVIDADAISCARKLKFHANAIITPHAHEFFELTGKKISGTIAQKKELAKFEAKKRNCVILLKGKTDIISDGNDILLNSTGNAAMTVGGTGDVLAGLCAAYLALGAKPIHAAATAAYVNGKIGEELFAKKGHGLIASDFLAQIPAWTKKIL
ncbi:MAG: NAD(P)H-hydrate dehydratase, partial [archaeon]|nr:NAD(P)H-hydrate dehydratase [archaeon]